MSRATLIGVPRDAFAALTCRISVPVVRRPMVAAATSFSGPCSQHRQRARLAAILAIAKFKSCQQTVDCAPTTRAYDVHTRNGLEHESETNESFAPTTALLELYFGFYRQQQQWTSKRLTNSLISSKSCIL